MTTTAVTPALTTLPTYHEAPSFCSKLKPLVEIIAQLAIRVLFIVGSLMIAAAAIPASVQGIGLPLVGVSSAFLAGFFFPMKKPSLESSFAQMPSLLEPYGPRAPLGLVNQGGNDCGINAMVHYLQSDPVVGQRFRPDEISALDALDRDAFLNLYPLQSPRLREGFIAYVEAQQEVRPVPSIRCLFQTFMQGYELPEITPNLTDAEKEEIRNCRREVLHYQDLLKGMEFRQSYCQFLARYEQARMEGQRVVSGTTNIRAAFQVLGDVQPANQIDPTELINPLLADLPNDQQILLEKQIHLPAAAIPRSPQPLFCNLVPLSLPSGKSHLTFQELLNRLYEEGNTGQKMNAQRVNPAAPNEAPIEFPILNTTCRFVQAPPVLRFHLLRFITEEPKENLLTKTISKVASSKPVSSWCPTVGSWLTYWWPPVGPRFYKNTASVQIPEEISIPVNGAPVRYRLTSFISHEGASKDSGHYISGRIIEGEKYLMNDSVVTLADQATWERKLQGSYLLNFVPV